MLKAKAKMHKQRLPQVGDLLLIKLHHKASIGIVIHDGLAINSLNIGSNNSWSNFTGLSDNEVIVLIDDFSLYRFGRQRMREFIRERIITTLSKFKESIAS